MEFGLSRRRQFVDRFGLRFWVYPKTDPVDRYKKRGSVTDAGNIIRYILDLPGEVGNCMDLGSNIGAVSVAMGVKTGGNAEVYAVEADSNNISRIHENLLLNGIPNHQVLNVAVAEKKGLLRLKRFDGINGWQTLAPKVGAYAKERPYREVPVYGVSLLELMEFLSVTSLDVLKLDIEGMEFIALQSIRGRLAQGFVERVIFEANAHTLEGFDVTVSDLLTFWNGLPYGLRMIREDGSTVPLSQTLAELPKVFDCVAVREGTCV
jgi:FkbM family methyltransferase